MVLHGVFPIFVNQAPPDWLWPLLTLAILIVVHHLVHGRRLWVWATGVAGSLALGWLFRNLGLGWFCNEYFGGWVYALAAYFAAGLFWLTCEVVRDLTCRVVPRFEAFRDDWRRNRTRGDGKARFDGDLRKWNDDNPSDLVIRPLSYWRSRSRWWWFHAWCFYWPVFAADRFLGVLIIDPFHFLSRILPTFVRAVTRIVVPRDIEDIEDGPGDGGDSGDYRAPDARAKTATR